MEGIKPLLIIIIIVLIFLSEWLNWYVYITVWLYNKHPSVVYTQYNFIINQYNTGSRLIVISQAIGNKRTAENISSGWDQFRSLVMAQMVCHWWVVFVRQHIVQGDRSSGLKKHTEHSYLEQQKAMLDLAHISSHSQHGIGVVLRQVRVNEFFTPVHTGKLHLHWNWN